MTVPGLLRRVGRGIGSPGLPTLITMRLLHILTAALRLLHILTAALRLQFIVITTRLLRIRTGLAIFQAQHIRIPCMLLSRRPLSRARRTLPILPALMTVPGLLRRPGRGIGSPGLPILIATRLLRILIATRRLHILILCTLLSRRPPSLARLTLLILLLPKTVPGLLRRPGPGIDLPGAHILIATRRRGIRIAVSLPQVIRIASILSSLPSHTHSYAATSHTHNQYLSSLPSHGHSGYVTGVTLATSSATALLNTGAEDRGSFLTSATLTVTKV